MTSTVTIKAHCSADKQVKIKVGRDGTHLIDDGEQYECVVYDDIMVAVREVPRVGVAPAQDAPKRRGRPPSVK
jgi:hypothetical protein